MSMVTLKLWMKNENFSMHNVSQLNQNSTGDLFWGGIIGQLVSCELNLLAQLKLWDEELFCSI